jgi:hypothetical protein
MIPGLSGARVSSSSLCSPVRALAWIVLLLSYAKILNHVRRPLTMRGEAMFCSNTWQATKMMTWMLRAFLEDKSV